MAFREVAVVLMVCIFGANALHKLSYRNCDERAPVQIREVHLKSFPIQIKPNARLGASGEYYNGYADATRETVFRIHLKIARKILWGYADITYLLPSAAKNLKVKCGDIPSPIPLCPGQTGEHAFDETIVLPANLNLAGIPSFLASGKYKVFVDVRDDASGRSIVCVKDAKVEIKL